MAWSLQSTSTMKVHLPYASALHARLKHLKARLPHDLVFDYHIVRSRLFSKQKLKILFSNQKPAWESSIKGGFQFTQHEIAFEELSFNNIDDYDLVVPLTIHDLKYLNGVRNLIIDNPIPIPSIESVLLCDDKYLLNQTLTANGFGTFIPKMEGILTYPYILKKRIDEWGQNSHIIAGAQQEQIFSDTLTHPEYFPQEFIPGLHEYATHIILKDHKIVCSLNIEYAFETETPIKGKDRPIYTKICRCPYLDVFSSLLMAIGFEGLCCINYKVVDNRPFILEINPRFGGSLCLFFFSFIEHVV
jgi:hypothetical protein